MDIEIHDHDPDLIPEFMRNDLVFKITTSEGKDIGMVTSREDYEKKLGSHRYIPILFVLSFYKQVAYLYGCLNHQYRESRQETFIFWWRRIHTKKWRPWFTVHPYKESIFES